RCILRGTERPPKLPEALPTSHTREVFSGFAERANTTVEAMLAERVRTGTLLQRLPTLAEVADFAAFVASDGVGRDDERHRQPDLWLARGLIRSTGHGSRATPSRGKCHSMARAGESGRRPGVRLRSTRRAQNRGRLFA